VAATVDATIPDHVISDRAPVLIGALKRLPDHLLEAMVAAVESNLDRLTVGTLLTDDGDGCVVGHTLRALAPRRYRSRGSRWLDRPRLGKWEREIARYQPRLAHVELAFDSCVEKAGACRPLVPERELASAVGIWISAEAQAELDRRRRRCRDGLVTRPYEAVNALSVGAKISRQCRTASGSPSTRIRPSVSA
jgi:hypothetical protein